MCLLTLFKKKICFCYPRLFAVLYKFENQFFHFCQKRFEILIGIVLGSTAILTILNLPSHAQRTSFHLFAAAAKLLQSCPTLCDPIDGSPPGSPVPGILQARTLECVAISFSIAWKWKVKVKYLSRVLLLETPWTAAYQAPLSMVFSRQENWSGLPLPSPALSLTSIAINLRLVKFKKYHEYEFLKLSASF